MYCVECTRVLGLRQRRRTRALPHAAPAAQVLWALGRQHSAARPLLGRGLLAAAGDRLARGAAALSLREAAMVAATFQDAR